MKMKIKQNGLTLIEVLVATGIMAILAAGLFAVSSYIDKKVKIERTKSVIHLLVTALDGYHDFYGKFPPDTENPYNNLILAPEAKKIIDQINRKAMKKEDLLIKFIDAWGMEFKYEYKDGDNFPVITSAGPDKDVNNTEDNISSKNL